MTSGMDGWSERTVGDVVAEDYGRAAIFQRYGIDFCCGGGRTVRSACEAAGVDFETVANALAAEVRRSAGTGEDVGRSGAGAWPLDVLTAHIVSEHHGYVRSTLPVLRQFTTRVAHVHGASRGELHEIRELVDALGAELERHMEDEEKLLFPRIAALASPETLSDLKDAVAPLEDDHERAGHLMARIRELSDGFRPPEGSCTTYRATYAKLAEFEADLHRHVHLENNVLFPRALAAAGVAGSTRG
jgi:regulator of cell morphogenesis and NO signaling